ncbi:MAG: hypothetical protein KJP16_06205 [Gammaproteobacteria bacterium]|nr:hypothetical protein [Gammaproteobacteria bacterium]NNL50395.1 hypothetical protein [Woeseiaceae bacterium]
MIAKHKIISLTIIGLVVGLILGMLGIGGANMLALIAVCGIVGFIAGWIWQTRSGEAEE